MPREALLAFAFRSALRVLPIALLVTPGEDAFIGEKGDRERIAAASLRAAMISYCAFAVSDFDAYPSANQAAFDVAECYSLFLNGGNSYSKKEQKFVYSARGSVYYESALRALEIAARAGYSSAMLVQARDASMAAGRSLLEFSNESGELREDIEYEYNADLDDLESGGHLHLLAQPLWRRAMPPRISQQWNSARNSLLARQAGFEIWVDWYERRLRGEALGYAVQDQAADYDIRRRFLHKDEFTLSNGESWWRRLESNELAVSVNAEIAGWVVERSIFEYSKALKAFTAAVALGNLAPPSESANKIFEDVIVIVAQIKARAQNAFTTNQLAGDLFPNPRAAIGGNYPPEGIDQNFTTEVDILMRIGDVDSALKILNQRVENLERAATKRDMGSIITEMEWWEKLASGFFDSYSKKLGEESASATVFLMKWGIILLFIINFPSLVNCITEIIKSSIKINL